MTTKAGVYPRKKQIGRFTFQTLQAGAGASPVLNPLDSSGRARLREYSQEKQGVPCRQVPSQLYLPYLNQSQSDDRGRPEWNQ